MSPSLRAAPIVALALGAGLSATEAQAHGRVPAAKQLVVDPHDTDRLYVRTTYGIVTSPDHGESWHWICPSAVGFDADLEDPALVVTTDGSVVAGTFDGLAVSRAGPCDFAYEGGELEGRFFTDVQPEADPSKVIAVSSNGAAEGVFEVDLWASSDAGHSWSHLGTAPPEDFLPLSLGAAPSDPQRLYLAGRDGPSESPTGALMRSDDRGTSWTRQAVPGADAGAFPERVTVHPDDADRLYLARAEKDDDDVVAFALLASDDGGETFTEVFAQKTAFEGIAISPDGTRIALGGQEQGLWIAEVDELAFSQVSDVRIHCLTWTEAGLYACTDPFVDGFIVGLSTDGGASFTPLGELASPCGSPPSCGEDTAVGSTCPEEWPKERAELGASDCETGDGTADSGAPPSPAGGCSCRAARYGRWRTPIGLALAMGALGVHRRRRSKKQPCR